MGSEWIIGVLALVTIGLVAAIAIYHFGTFLKDPRNRGAAANVALGGRSASDKVQAEAPVGSYHDRPLKARLDDSEASAHPADPKDAATKQPGVSAGG